MPESRLLFVANPPFPQEKATCSISTRIFNFLKGMEDYKQSKWTHLLTADRPWCRLMKPKKRWKGQRYPEHLQ